MLFVLVVAAWFPGFLTLPPLDRDESRFAQATSQMIETGNYVDIRLGEGARYKKPAGIYWLQAIPTALFNNAAAERDLDLPGAVVPRRAGGAGAGVLAGQRLCERARRRFLPPSCWG